MNLNNLGSIFNRSMKELDAWRPTEDEMVAEMYFKVELTGNYDPELEHGEFHPVTIVRCGKQIKHDTKANEVLVAVEKMGYLIQHGC